MERSTLAIRLDRDLIELLDQQAQAAGCTRYDYLTAVIESTLRGSGNFSVTSSFEVLKRRCQELLQVAHALAVDINTLRISVEKDREPVLTRPAVASNAN
jgi:hypothetical protein